MLVKKIWQVAETKPGIQSVLARELKIPRVVAQILANRGINSVIEAQQFLSGDLKHMHHPSEMPGMFIAVERILKALQKRERVVIYGDYDVDGVTSTSVLMRIFTKLGMQVSYYLPDRKTEGYGPNCKAFAKLKDQGTDLIVTVDCGVSAFKEVEYARELGMDVIVTDHHEPPEVLPPALTIIDPKLADCTYPFKHLCGAGVAYKLGQAVLSALNPQAQWWTLAYEVLDLVCLGTVADIVPLQGENRIIVREGLKLLGKADKPGVRALVEVCALAEKEITSGHVGFMLAPRLNAAGRMGDAKVGVELLTTDDEQRAREIAQDMNRENELRQAVEAEIVAEAMQMIEHQYDLAKYPVIVLAGPWHHGVIGIVASRIVERFYRPTILLSLEEEQAKGSCRSIAGLDMYEALKSCEDLLIKYGGHKQAAGLSLPKENIEVFRERMNAYALATLTEADYIPRVELDGEIDFQDISMKLLDELEKLAPFGYRNPQPVLACRQAEVMDCRSIGKEGNHLKLKIKGGQSKWDAVGFKMGHLMEPLNKCANLDMAVTIEKNEWNGRVNLQFILKDLKLSNTEDNPFNGGVNGGVKDNKSFIDKLFEQAETTLEDDFYRGIDQREEFFTKVVGVTFENRQEVVQNLHEGEELRLVREPENRFDPNAIRVENQQGDQIGYFNSRMAKHLAPVLDKGGEYQVLVSSLTGGKNKNLGVNILVNRASGQDQAAKKAELDQIRAELSKKPDAELIDAIRGALLGAFDYRSKQQEAIQALMEGRRVLAIFGTGRGKSAVFQSVAAYKALREQKTTIILYPLRALVNDQYEAMSKKLGRLGLRVYRANGSISDQERAEFFAALEQRSVDVVLTTPEFLECHLRKFSKLRNQVGLLVADESHHIGMAGSHRPAYGRLGRIITELGAPPVAAVTATAKEEVADTIIATLGINHIIIDPHVRQNLKIVDARGNPDKPGYLRDLVTGGKKTAIYVNSRQQTIDLARYLREVLPQHRDTIAFYNAGLTNEQRATIEQLFREGHLQVVVTTSAFGEGIDIPDVENVALYHLNFNFTEFNQQSGRGGRDGRQARIHLLFGSRDVNINEFILESTAPNRETLGKLYLLLKQLAAKTSPLQMTNGELAEELKSKGVWTARDNTVSVGIAILEELGLVEREMDGRQRYLTVNSPPGTKLDLNKSLRYTEGLHEKVEFDTFQQSVLKSPADALLNMINQPIYPKKFLDDTEEM